RVFFRSVAFEHGREDYHGRVPPDRVEEAERGEIHASLSVDARHPSDGPRRDAGFDQSVDVDRLGRGNFDFRVGSSLNEKTGWGFGPALGVSGGVCRVNGTAPPHV